MPKFRKIPVVIEAVRVSDREPAPLWLANAFAAKIAIPNPYDHGAGSVLIKTLEGEMRADPGDWIIQGVNGEIYPCKPDIFAKTYEPADAPQLHPVMIASLDPEDQALIEELMRQPGHIVYTPDVASNREPPFTIDDLLERGVDRQTAEWIIGEEWTPEQSRAMRDAMVTGQGATRITHEPGYATNLAADLGLASPDTNEDWLNKASLQTPHAASDTGGFEGRAYDGAGNPVRTIGPDGMVYLDGVAQGICAKVDTGNAEIAQLNTALRLIDEACVRAGRSPDEAICDFIDSFGAKLQAEGEHTAAANANIDRLNTEIERITRRQQGVLSEIETKR